MSKHHNSLQEALLSRLPSLTAEMSVSLSYELLASLGELITHYHYTHV